MTHPRVHVSVTFVTTKVGSKPIIYIDSPIDLSERVGDIRSNKYDQLKSKMVNIVEDTKSNLFFHKDTTHRCMLDESALQDGVVYGLKERQSNDGGDASKKVTARNSVPIQSASDFKKYLDEVSEVVYVQ